MFEINFPQWDRDLFIYLNSKNLPWLDQIMIAFSTYTAWAIVCLIVIGIITYKDRINGKTASLFLIGGVTVTLLLNILIKLAFMRPRPGHEDLLSELIYLLEETGNSYSFFSGHSSSSFCLATFSALYFRNKLYSFIIFIWAFSVAYSRIYVGKHYPLDVIVGILFGMLMGWISYWFYNRYRKKETQDLYFPQ